MIRSGITYVCRTCELSADNYLLTLQRLRNKILCIIGNFSECTSVHVLNRAFNQPYVYDYITKLCRKQSEVIQNYENEHVCGVGQGKADIENI
jgi:hypothetical protein